VSHEGEDGLYLRIEDEQTQRPRTILVDLQTLGSSGYSSDRRSDSRPACAGKVGERLRLSYDAFLADQTVRLDTDRLDYDPALRVLTPNVNWEEWLEGRGPERRHTALTTSNRDFNKRMGELQRFIYEARAMHGPAYVPHLSWKNEFSHYKFIEHMVLKRREGKLKFSHAERLMAIPATWGKNETPLHDIVGRFIEWH